MAGDVTSQHADYTEALPRWTKVEDASCGEDAVKAKKWAYLPQPNAQDKSAENVARGEAYITRAVYYNATGRTLNGLLGLAFDEDPVVKVPPAIDAVQSDASGSGVTLFQHAQATLAEILKTGRGGLLTDYPKTEAPISKADEARGDVRPTLSFYPATAVINWRTTQRAGKTILSLVVLSEQHEEQDGFATKCVQQYRVLRLDGAYIVEIWRKVRNATTHIDEWVIVDSHAPLRGDGRPWDVLPFQFIGAQNNDWTVDDAPLYDIAVLNIAHYRNSADYEDSVYMVGQPQVWMAGLDQTWVDMLEKRGIYFGSRAILPLPVGGTAGIMQADPNTLAKGAMDSKEIQMAAIGARLLQPTTGSVKTATQQRSEDVVAHSVLSLCCENVSAGYRTALEWYAIFANAPETGLEFTISTEFSENTIDAQMLTALVQAVQAGKLPLSAFWEKLRAVGLIPADQTDDDIQEELDSAMVPGAAGALDPAADSASPHADPAASGAQSAAAGDPAMNNGGSPPPAVDHAAIMQETMQPITDALTKLTEAMTAMAAREPAAPVAQPPAQITVNVPEQKPPVVNIAPAAITVESPTINVTVPEQQPPVVNIAPAAITVESPTITVNPAAAPNVQVDGATINVLPPPPMKTTTTRDAKGNIVSLTQEVVK